MREKEREREIERKRERERERDREKGIRVLERGRQRLIQIRRRSQ